MDLKIAEEDCMQEWKSCKQPGIKIKRVLWSFCFLLMTSVSIADNLDSLKAVAEQATDTIKVNVLIRLSSAYVNSNPEQSIYYANQARTLAEELNFQKGLAYAFKNIGLSYYILGEYIEVLNSWHKSLEIFQKIGDKAGESNLNSNIGAVYFNYGDYPQALEHYLESMRIAEQIEDNQRIAIVLNNIGAIYEDQKNYLRSRDNYLRALQISTAINFKPMIGTSLVNLGTSYLLLEKIDSALYYFEESIPALEGEGYQEKVAHAYVEMGKAYSNKGNYSKAFEFKRKALEKARVVNARLEIAEANNGLGDYYRIIKQPEEAIVHYSRARDIAGESGFEIELKVAYEGLSRSYAALKDFSSAYDYQLLLTATKDSLFNTETVKKIGNLQNLYENEKNQAQIALLTKDKALQNAELERQQVEKNALIVGLVLIVVIAFILFRVGQIRHKANRLLEQRNEEIRQQKEEIETQRDNLEQTYNHLKNTQDQLIQSEKMASLGQLTAGVAHEINNPINFVSGGIDSLQANFMDIIEVATQYFSLKEGEDNSLKIRKLNQLKQQLEIDELIEESHQLFRSIRNGANRTTEIVKSLRNFTRLDESVLKEADLQEGLDSTLVILANQTKGRIEVIKNYENPGPVQCYPGQLNQVFMNILTNAIQAIEDTGKIWVSTTKTEKHAVIRIRDSGKGMPEDVKKKIFEPFYTTKDVGVGTGLGLSITYGIIEKHKGKIEVESKPGVGTEFILKIPLDLQESAASEKVSVG
jgi:signal transduction histidine kinase